MIAPDNSEHLQMIAATKADLDFFLVEKGESDPWAYALYHCGTSSNVYSSVHWSFVDGWHAREPEVLYESHRERDLYNHSSDESAYRDFFWPHRKGIHRGGEFPVAVVRKKYEERGYHCWISAQSKHGVDSYLLERMPGKRRHKDPAYLKMVDVFGSLLDEFHQLASAARQLNGLSKPGGDPDLFVQCRDDSSDKFFVEVKLEDLTGRRRYKDEPNKQQRVLFPLIEKKLNCEVKLAMVCLQS
jgi:hypothetical protein